jgi:hypothetical protein
VRFLEFQTPSTPQRDPSQEIPDLNSSAAVSQRPSHIHFQVATQEIFTERAAATPPPYSQDVLTNHIY